MDIIAKPQAVSLFIYPSSLLLHPFLQSFFGFHNQLVGRFSILCLVQFVQKAGYCQQAAQSGKGVQMAAVVGGTDQEKNIGQRTIAAKGYAA
jgi:hypothetical protein